MKKEYWLLIILTLVIIILIGALFFVGNGKNANSDIKGLSIKSGQEITSPLSIEGQAKGSWFFESNFPIKITDKDGNVLGTSYVQAQSDWMTEDFVPFKGVITFSSETGGEGFLILSKDNPSGLPEYDKSISIPITFQSQGYMKVKVFFNNNNLDPQISCDKVFSTERNIQKVEAVGAAALSQLLKGPTVEDVSQGFYTNINTGVKLNSLEIDENGVAHADFDQQLEHQVGGSCKTAAIRAQITETLKQFSTVKDVVISINGRTEDILQP